MQVFAHGTHGRHGISDKDSDRDNHVPSEATFRQYTKNTKEAAERFDLQFLRILRVTKF